MSVVKEQIDERFQERIDTTIKDRAREMVQNLSLLGLPVVLREDLEKYLLGRLDDYFNNEATYEQREDLLNCYEHLPF